MSTQAPPILGLSSCLSLNLIQLLLSVEERQSSDTVSQTPGDISTEYKDVFEGLGSFPGVHQIQLKPNVNPVIHPPWKVPIALRDKLEKELERMESLEGIAKVMEPTNWVNSIATPEKQRTGALRVYLDPRDLNHLAVMCEHYPLPTLEELTLILSVAKYFSVLDATSGYWQIKLDEESSQHTVQMLPFHQNAIRHTFSTRGVPWTWHLKALTGANLSLMICLSGDRPSKKITKIWEKSWSVQEKLGSSGMRKIVYLEQQKWVTLVMYSLTKE